VIHAHWWLPSGWLASSFGYPLVVTVHGSDVRLLDHSALARNLARRVLRKATAITTVSDFLARDLGARLPNFAQRIRTVPMPVDIEKFASGKRVPKKSPPLVLYAGNLLESKGVDILLRAYAKLRASDVRCQLKILGEGPATSSLRRLASELGIAREVVWSNFVPQDAMPAEYGASTITVLPTRGNAEGLGLTLVEALLAGCAVVGTPAGGIPEIVRDQVTGLVARDGDSDDLASKIGRLIADPSLRDRLQSAGEELARKRFAADLAVSSIISIYDDAARNRIAS
jgi:glycosyltransferase involved in cell wall biosynthesis